MVGLVVVSYKEEGAHMHGGDRRRQGKGMTGQIKEEPRVK